MKRFGPATILVMLFALVAAPNVLATHWCDWVALTLSPGTVTVDERTLFTVSVANAGNQTLEAALRVQFPWDTRSTPWGSVSVPPGQSRGNTFAKVVAGSPGEHAATLTVAGQVAGEGPVSCPAVVRALRLEPAFPAPQIVVRADRTSGPVPLTVNLTAIVSGGSPPATVTWDLDGKTASGANASVTFRQPGEYWVQATATDARGRLAVDRTAIAVLGSSPRSPSGLVDGALVVAWTLLGALLVGQILTVREVRRLRASLTDSRAAVPLSPESEPALPSGTEHGRPSATSEGAPEVSAPPAAQVDAFSELEKKAASPLDDEPEKDSARITLRERLKKLARRRFDSKADERGGKTADNERD